MTATDNLAAIEAAAALYWDRETAYDAALWEDIDAEMQADVRERVLEIVEAANPALIALVREQAAQIARVEKLAADWESRGEADMAYSKTVPDEEVAIQLLGNGAQLVDDARLIRAALTEGTAMSESETTLLEDTDPATVFNVQLSVPDAVDAIEDGLRNDSMENLNTLAFNIWGLLIDASNADPAALDPTP